MNRMGNPKFEGVFVNDIHQRHLSISMLQDLETHVDSTRGRLDAVMKRVDKLLAENGGIKLRFAARRCTSN